MRSHRRKLRRRFFSLAEMMAALLILSVMMLTLFEMIVTTQHMWSAADSRITVHDNARIFFDIVGQDLKSMVVDASTATNIKYRENDEDTSNRKKFTFVTRSGIGLKSTDTNDLIEVHYYYNEDDNNNKKIERRYSTISDGATNWDFYNTDPATYNDTHAHSDVIVEGVRSVEMRAYSDFGSTSNSGLSTTDVLPSTVMVRIVLEDPELGQKEQKKSEYEFYKVFFIN
jgi:hypothetical protein